MPQNHPLMSRDWSGLRRLSSTAESGIKGALVLIFDFITALVDALSGEFKMYKLEAFKLLLKVVIFAG